MLICVSWLWWQDDAGNDSCDETQVTAQLYANASVLITFKVDEAKL